MKKLFSILCAFAIVFSASAVPAKRAGLAKFAKEHAKEVKAQKSLKAEKATSFATAAVQQTATKAPAKQHFTVKPAVLKAENASFTKAPLSAKAQAAKVAKAKKEATDVTIGSWEVQDWGSDGELYLYAEDNTIAIYADLIYGGDAEDLVPGKEYTVADVYVSESTGEQYAAVFYDGEWHYGVKELSVTKTIDEKNLVHFVGSVVDSLDAAFTFHFDEEEFKPTGEVVEHEFKYSASVSYFSTYGQWSVKADDGKFAFRMDLFEKSSESPVGTYLSDSADFDIDYCYFEVYNATGDSSWQYKPVEAAAVITESNDSILIAIDFLCDNGVEYKATAFVADPTAQEHVDFVATDYEIDDSFADFFGVVWFDAFNDDATLSLTLYPEDAEDLSGDYLISQTDTLANAAGSITTADGEFSIYSGNVKIAKNGNDYVVTGKVLAFNNVEYTLAITYVKPEPTRQAELTVAGLELSFDLNAEVPWWQLYGYNADSTIMVTVSPIEADSFAGHYTGAELDPAYTYIVTDITYDEYGEFDTYNYFKLIDADLNVTYNEADSTMVITGKYVGRNLTNRKDVPEISINFSGKIPAPEVSDMTFTFQDGEGEITVTPSNDEDEWDWYVASEDIFEYYGADGIAEAIFGNYGNTYAVSGEQVLSIEDDFANYLEGSGTYYLIVWGAGKRNVTTPAASHKFEYESTLPEGCTEYDAEEGNDFIVDFAEYVIDDRYLAQYGVLLVDAQNADGSYISIQFVVPTGAESLVAGEYPVQEDGEAQSVYSGELDLTEGQIYGSFAGNLTAQGISIPLWLFVDGKVTVNADGSIAVDVTNCAGAKIQCTLAEAQGIENVVLTEDAKKVVVDGVLYIVRDNKLYTIQGTQVR